MLAIDIWFGFTDKRKQVYSLTYSLNIYITPILVLVGLLKGQVFESYILW